MKLALAIALIVLGVMGLAYGGISFTHEKKDVDLGPIQVSHERRDTLPISLRHHRDVSSVARRGTDGDH